MNTNTDIGTVCASDGETLLHMWCVEVEAGIRPLRRHSHIRFEIMRVDSGDGEYTVGERVYPMRAGDMFVFASNEQHCITAVGEGGLGITNLQFEPRYLWGYSTDSLSEESINLCFAHNEHFRNRLPAAENGALRELFDTVVTEFMQAQPEYALTVKSLLNLMLVRLIRRHGYADSTASLSRGRLHSIRRVIRYIDEHLCEDLTLSTLASVAGMTPNYFSSLFHTVSGISLWKYIINKRVDKAMRLLQQPEVSILTVATTCGFNNTANFNKAFKKITDMTPSDYRLHHEPIS